MPDQYRIKGAFFENLKGGGPAFTGFVDVDVSQLQVGPDGRAKIQLALWPKVSQAGQNYLQASEDKKKPVPGSAPPKASPFKARAAPVNRPSDMDDDIPF